MNQIDVRGCARCGSAHDNLKVHRFENPADEFTHWATCPNTKDPILIKFIETAPDEVAAPKSAAPDA